MATTQSVGLKLRTSDGVARGGFRLDLDHYDAILAALRRGAASFRVMVGGQLLNATGEIPSRYDLPIYQLDIEAHNPYLRFRFGTSGEATTQGKQNLPLLCELTTVRDDPAGEALFAKVERIILSARPDRPVRSWVKEHAPWNNLSTPAFSALVACGFPVFLFLTFRTIRGILVSPDVIKATMLALLCVAIVGVGFGAMIGVSIYSAAVTPVLTATRGSGKKPKEPADPLI